jgi:peptidoglycan/LPS O-acetylase OafA/YrhL
MGSLGLLLLAVGFIVVGLYMHKRRAAWPGFIAVALGGVVLTTTAQGRWAAGLVSHIPYAALWIVVGGAVVIGLDLRDRRPDRPAVMMAAIVPLFLALAIAQVPHVIDAIGTAVNHVGNDTAHSTRER